MPWTESYRRAIVSLAVAEGWTNGWSDMPCHQNGPSLTYRVAGTDVELVVCLTCLQGYMQVKDLTIGPQERTLPVATRSCGGCTKRLPLSDFVSLTGKLTSYCPDCRCAWAVQKRADEEAEIKEEWAKAANRLRRIESELSE